MPYRAGRIRYWAGALCCALALGACSNQPVANGRAAEHSATAQQQVPGQGVGDTDGGTQTTNTTASDSTGRGGVYVGSGH
jgi:hypothetical protein